MPCFAAGQWFCRRGACHSMRLILLIFFDVRRNMVPFSSIFRQRPQAHSHLLWRCSFIILSFFLSSNMQYPTIGIMLSSLTKNYGKKKLPRRNDEIEARSSHIFHVSFRFILHHFFVHHTQSPVKSWVIKILRSRHYPVWPWHTWLMAHKQYGITQESR